MSVRTIEKNTALLLLVKEAFLHTLHLNFSERELRRLWQEFLQDYPGVGVGPRFEESRRRARRIERSRWCRWVYRRGLPVVFPAAERSRQVTNQIRRSKYK